MNHRVLRVLLVLSLAGATTLGLFGCGESEIPAPFLCTSAPMDATLTDLAIGTGPLGFRPLADGAATHTTTGSVGSTLISLKAAWRGAEAPPCARVHFFVFDPSSGRELVNRDYQLDSTPIADWNASGEVYFDADGWPPEVVVEITIYGNVLRLTLQVGGFVTEDAGASADAGPGDAGA